MSPAAGPAAAASARTGLLGRAAAASPLLLFLLWLAAGALWRPLMLPDEGRYVGVAWEMLQRGDGLTPTLDGLPYFHKPPLFYWITAAAMRLLGAQPLALRAAPLLGAWAMGLAAWLWIGGGRSPARRREATLALALLATTPLGFLGAQYADCDMLVAGFISLTIVCARRALGGRRPAPAGWAVAAAASAALAVLAKGLIGVVLPALVLLPWLLATGRARRAGRLLQPAALLVFVLLAAPWFVAAQRAHPGFFDYFVVEQHFRRYTQAVFNNREPAWFFVAVLPLATLPASAWGWAALQRLRAAWRRAGVHAEPVFAAWWLAVVLLFFSLPASKLVGYVLPALLPLVLLLVRA
ncbi:glycosyltransferase family 39 protein, partial [Rubrivivax gelatinosus]|nr:hypothetical protein [Rubrivivax gelatinosus]